jgi:hypothetical protein
MMHDMRTGGFRPRSRVKRSAFSKVERDIKVLPEGRTPAGLMY